MSPCTGLTGRSCCCTWCCQLCLAVPGVNWLFLKQLTSLWVCFQHCSPELAAAHLPVPAQRFLACTRTSCMFNKLAETCHPIPSPLTSQMWHAKSHHFKLLQALSCCESSLSPSFGWTSTCQSPFLRSRVKNQALPAASFTASSLCGDGQEYPQWL